MSVKAIQTVTCDGPNCDKAVAFTQEEAKTIVETAPWLKSLRVIGTSDNRNLSYCSDACEVDGVATGKHNPAEEKKIIDIDGNKAQLAIRQAQAHADASRKSDKALKTGLAIVD